MDKTMTETLIVLMNLVQQPFKILAFKIFGRDLDNFQKVNPTLHYKLM